MHRSILSLFKRIGRKSIWVMVTIAGIVGYATLLDDFTVMLGKLGILIDWVVSVPNWIPWLFLTIWCAWVGYIEYRKVSLLRWRKARKRLFFIEGMRDTVDGKVAMHNQEYKRYRDAFIKHHIEGLNGDFARIMRRKLGSMVSVRNEIKSLLQNDGNIPVVDLESTPIYDRNPAEIAPVRVDQIQDNAVKAEYQINHEKDCSLKGRIDSYMQDIDLERTQCRRIIEGFEKITEEDQMRLK